MLKSWRDSGKSQRQLAKEIGVPFNTVHSRIEYAKSQLRRADNMIEHTEITEVKTVYGHGEQVPVPENELIASVDRGEGYYPGRMAIFDIETASLNAQSVQTVLACVCLLTLDTNQLYTLTLDFDAAQLPDDTRLLSSVMGMLRGYDILIGHFINGFDIGWLRTRALRAGLPPQPAWNTIDTLTLAKRTAKKAQRKSLGMLMDLLGLGWEKTGVNTNAWSQIFVPDPEVFDKTMAQIVYHCQQDVLGTRGLVYKLWPSALLLGGIPLSHNQ
jgi:uncharacterized protein YprB with RNaseH-like and TPR domain